MKITSSPMLLDFYKSWYAREDERYYAHGMCASTYLFVEGLLPDVPVLGQFEYARELIKELKDQFVEAGLDDDYPFNQPDGEWDVDAGALYSREVCNRGIYNNTARVTWVENRLNDGVDETKGVCKYE